MSSFQCPFCGITMPKIRETLRELRINFYDHSIESWDAHTPYMYIQIYRCPNESCRKESVLISGQNGYIDNRTVLVYPPSTAKRFPPYVPKAIRSDYEEACAILHRSPKASATLARRCLQGMIRDFWGIKRARLVDEVKELQDKVPTNQWSAIDALRSLGNIGAHMEKDVNLIVDIDPHEATALVRLIELLMDQWYVKRHETQLLYDQIQTVAQKKQAARQSQANPEPDQIPQAAGPQSSNTV